MLRATHDRQQLEGTDDLHGLQIVHEVDVLATARKDGHDVLGSKQDTLWQAYRS